MHSNSTFINLLKAEVVPALGCTEPIAVALAVAKARETLGEKPSSIKLLLSANIFKNGMGVGIPGTGMIGLHIAAALGAIYGKSADCLELLTGITDSVVDEAKTIVDTNKVLIEIKEGTEKLYIEAICNGANGQYAKAIIAEKHSNILLVEKNGEVIECNQNQQNNESAETIKEKVSLTIEEIFNFITRVPVADIEFMLKTVDYNDTIAQEGLSKKYGLSVGRKLKSYIDKGILSDDLMNNAMYLTAAASDARMSGCTLPVMSNSGSGNQGITATLPVYSAAKYLKANQETLVRALALSHLVSIHIKTYLGRLSALCGCIIAATGAGCGVSYIMGGGLNETIYTIKNMVGNVTGMVCDGAKEGCALKVSTGVSSAIQSALLGLEGTVISSNDGIIDEDVEKTIQNLGRIGSEGMNQTDKLLLEIMVSKGKA
ncbi:MAG: L-serine ammonia-lyase, iron-sulfur-dependent, subunit alpha [Bacteroidales bacterium]|nr:L-serine ammonia-lyase, iron-sulfur-dependent, subunit alpha [Bacteroidales bacterium]MDY0196788.1 L-serine ammonia-lyase, iron-sulfur-dependent, subunit alpha [Tenuifilaceae bacterium]